MTKTQFVKSIVQGTGVDTKTVEYIVDQALLVLKNTVVSGENVSLRAFGTFSRQHRKAKIGRDITHNTAVEIPAHYVPRFKPAKEFSDAVALGE